jgi:iron-regulated transporter 1
MLLHPTFCISAAQVVLFAQNSLLVICATTVALTFFFWESIYFLWDGRLISVLHAVIVLTAAMSRIASVGTAIVVEKDWIVVLAEGDLNQLASKQGSICNYFIIILLACSVDQGLS